MENKKIEVYGDEYTLLDMTAISDAAKYLVESIFDKNAPEHLSISGETLTIAKWKNILEQETKDTWTFEYKGSAEELNNEWRTQQVTLGMHGAMEWMPKMFKANMYLGQGKMFTLHTERYPNVKPISVSEFVKNIGR